MSDETSTADRPVPPFTAAMREQARRSPGTWIYSIDPAYDPDGAVPGYGILGAWPVDAAGEPGTFLPNPDYRPSPAQLALDAPTDPVEAAMQRAGTGHGSADQVVESLAGRTVYVPADADGELIAYRDEAGDYVVLLTDPAQALPTIAQLLPVEFSALLDRLPAGTALWINPGSAVSMGVTSTQLRPSRLPGIPRKG
jgi:hypothetical protein